MLSKRKKAIMGIGTLIIFIATILVAAVAAGVLISTSGVLQQRALLTGTEARKKITNAVEVISILAYGNRTDESLNNFEILVRLDAGSDPTQMKRFDISFIGPYQNAAGKLAMPSYNDPRVDPYSFYENLTMSTIDNNTVYDILDIDGDGEEEKMYLSTPFNSTVDYLVINFTDKDADYARYQLKGRVVTSNEIEVVDGPIIGQDGTYYGYFQIDASVPQNGTLNVSGNNHYIEISKYFTGECDFDVLPPEDYYCFKVMHGDDDDVLGDGEVLMLKYKLKEANKLYIGEDFQFILAAEKGRMTRIQARTPDIIQTIRVPLWPLG